MTEEYSLQHELDCTNDDLARTEMRISILIHDLHSAQLRKERLLETIEDMEEALKGSQASA